MLLHVETPAPLLVAAATVYAVALLHLVARDVERARWQRQFGGWRALQRDRIDRAWQPAAPFLAALRARFTRPRPVHSAGRGWRAVQRHRIDRAVW